MSVKASSDKGIVASGANQARRVMGLSPSGAIYSNEAHAALANLGANLARVDALVLSGNDSFAMFFIAERTVRAHLATIPNELGTTMLEALDALGTEELEALMNGFLRGEQPPIPQKTAQVLLRAFGKEGEKVAMQYIGLMIDTCGRKAKSANAIKAVEEELSRLHPTQEQLGNIRKLVRSPEVRELLDNYVARGTAGVSHAAEASAATTPAVTHVSSSSPASPTTQASHVGSGETTVKAGSPGGSPGTPPVRGSTTGVLAADVRSGQVTTLAPPYESGAAVATELDPAFIDSERASGVFRINEPSSPSVQPKAPIVVPRPQLPIPDNDNNAPPREPSRVKPAAAKPEPVVPGKGTASPAKPAIKYAPELATENPAMMEVLKKGAAEGRIPVAEVAETGCKLVRQGKVFVLVSSTGEHRAVLEGVKLALHGGKQVLVFASRAAIVAQVIMIAVEIGALIALTNVNLEKEVTPVARRTGRQDPYAESRKKAAVVESLSKPMPGIPSTRLQSDMKNGAQLATSVSRTVAGFKSPAILNAARDDDQKVAQAEALDQAHGTGDFYRTATRTLPLAIALVDEAAGIPLSDFSRNILVYGGDKTTKMVKDLGHRERLCGLIDALQDQIGMLERENRRSGPRSNAERDVRNKMVGLLKQVIDRAIDARENNRPMMQGRAFIASLEQHRGLIDTARREREAREQMVPK